ncbi:hypothetical protein ACFOU2_02355 [Bacillus songklensis]|uniref:Uncharacterized protein n=1 Tax=Bacillus songklensis TaxID=1069116 RepID=A0ABV8AZQ6_9BACI
MKLETMKTMAFDIKDLVVFDNDTEAIMYVTKDIYSDSYIIAIPVITFAWVIRTEHPEQDYDWLLKSNIGIGDLVRKEI